MAKREQKLLKMLPEIIEKLNRLAGEASMSAGVYVEGLLKKVKEDK